MDCSSDVAGKYLKNSLCSHVNNLCIQPLHCCLLVAAVSYILLPLLKFHKGMQPLLFWRCVSLPLAITLVGKMRGQEVFLMVCAYALWINHWPLTINWLETSMWHKLPLTDLSLFWDHLLSALHIEIQLALASKRASVVCQHNTSFLFAPTLANMWDEERMENKKAVNNFFSTLTRKALITIERGWQL